MHSLRTKILIIGLAFLAIISTAFVFYSVITTENYKRLRRGGIEETVTYETEKINKIITVLEQGAVNIAIDGYLFYQSQSFDIGKTSALEYLRSLTAVIGGGFWFEPYAYNKETLRACIYAYYDKALGEVVIDEFDVDEYNYHSLDWYREIADSITQPYQTVWTKPYIDDTSYSMMTTAGAGIFERDGTMIGISILDWEIEEVVRELSAIKPTEKSFVLLCAPEKDYIISDTHNSAAAGESISSIPWNIKADSFVLDGIKYMRFGRYMDNDWLLSIQIPENEIYAEVERHNSFFSIIITVSSAIMIYLAYYLISKLINTPIKQLTAEVNQIALGNLDMRIKLNSKDELGLLASAFNNMTADLRKSIDNYTHEHLEKERMSTELNIAAKIQAGMIPFIFPPFPGRAEFDIYASMLPAKEIGGDFYDFYFIDENSLAVIIADVSGKGVPAALFMVITKILVKNGAYSGKSPREVFETVNNIMCENNDTSMFVTAFMGVYNIASGRFIYANAGHNPFFLKRKGKDYEAVSVRPNFILGYMENVTFREDEILLQPGDTLFLYTDGVTEAMNSGKELFAVRRLAEALNANRDAAPQQLLSSVKKEIDRFADGAEQADDITMLALNILNPAKVRN